MTISNAFGGGSELFTTSDKMTYDMGSENVYVYKVVEDGNVSIDISYSRVKKELIISKEGDEIQVVAGDKQLIFDEHDIKSEDALAKELTVNWGVVIHNLGLDVSVPYDLKELVPILAKFIHALYTGIIK